MGSINSKKIQFEKDPKHQIQTLCQINQQGNDIEFLEGDLLPFLLSNQNKSIKILTVVGEAGAGKSTIIELIAGQIIGKPCRIFKSDSTAKAVTKGIQYLTCETQQDIIIFFDCEGFETILDNFNTHQMEEYNQKLYLMIGQIARLSTMTLHISDDLRIKASFERFLQAIDIEEKHKNDQNYFKQIGILSNFIEILNHKNDLKASKKEQYPILHKNFYFQEFNEDGENKIILKNKSYDTIVELANDIRKNTFSCHHENTEAFQNNQTCRAFYEVLIASLNIIKERGLKEKKNFANLINLQLQCKNYVQKYVSQMIIQSKIEMDKQANKIMKQLPSNHISFQFMFAVSCTIQKLIQKIYDKKILDTIEVWKNQFTEGARYILQFDNNNEEAIVQQYLNMDGLKPKEIKAIEDFQEKTTNQNILSVAALSLYGGGLIAAIVSFDALISAELVAMSTVSGVGAAFSWTIVGLVVSSVALAGLC
ncbi:hypothetical protein ABPG72_001049 [Tetrahymena utriculariae]